MSETLAAIIGAGPAGLATAIQLRRYRLPFLLLECAQLGGLLHNADLVENYPGFPGGMRGVDLVRLFEAQAAQTGVRVTHAQALALQHDGRLFHVRTAQASYTARYLVLATGTQPLEFPTELIPDAARGRVFYEVRRLGDVHDCRVAIVGAGDAAFDYALNLARRNQVQILNRGEQLRCLPLLWERASANPQISYYSNRAIARVESAPDGGLRLECHPSGGNSALEIIQADYLVGALGRRPRLELLQGIKDYPVLESQGLLHVIGDARRGVFRQTAIAVGDGVLAAMKIYHSIQERL